MIDSHCHLDLACFDDDIEQVIQRALDNDVHQFIIPGIEPEHWVKSVRLAAQFPQCYYTLGYHPFFYPSTLNAASIEPMISTLAAAIDQAITQRGFVGVGEIGIDRTLSTDLPLQIALFDAQLHLAKTYRTPVIIHHRKSHDQIIGRLKATQFDQGGIIHAFSGNAEIARQYIDLGFCLGVGGTITYPRGHKTLNAIQHVGIEHCVLETDSPDMPMLGRQGQRNEPAYIRDVLDILDGALPDSTVNEIELITSKNVRRIFIQLQ